MQNLDFPAQQSCCVRRFERTDRLKISPFLKLDLGASSGHQAYGYSLLLALGLRKICKVHPFPKLVALLLITSLQLGLQKASGKAGSG